MLYRIADLLADIPAAGGLASRCKGYMCNFNSTELADIIIDPLRFRPSHYPEDTPEEMVAYLESGWQFYLQLINFGGFYIHSSAVVRDGKAYLFSGNSGVGKSTHTRLWQSTFGGDVHVINDDKPALRRLENRWYAYGTPWCGKDGINSNEKVPLAGLCFLKQASENKIRRLSKFEAMQKIMGQTMFRFYSGERLDKFLVSLNLFLDEIPVYELENVPEPSAAQLSYETMRAGVPEVNL